MTKAAEKAGADGALVVGPYYNKPMAEGYYRHFAAVADAIGASRLAEVRRQGLHGWQREASAAFGAGDAVEGPARYDAKGRVVYARRKARYVPLWPIALSFLPRMLMAFCVRAGKRRLPPSALRF